MTVLCYPILSDNNSDSPEKWDRRKQASVQTGSSDGGWRCAIVTASCKAPLQGSERSKLAPSFVQLLQAFMVYWVSCIVWSGKSCEKCTWQTVHALQHMPWEGELGTQFRMSGFCWVALKERALCGYTSTLLGIEKAALLFLTVQKYQFSNCWNAVLLPVIHLNSSQPQEC